MINVSLCWDCAPVIAILDLIPDWFSARQSKMKNYPPSNCNIQTYFIFKSIPSLFFDPFHQWIFLLFDADISLEILIFFTDVFLHRLNGSTQNTSFISRDNLVFFFHLTSSVWISQQGEAAEKDKVTCEVKEHGTAACVLSHFASPCDSFRRIVC